MKLEIELDLEKTLAAALAPEKLAPILDKHIADALNTAISDATGYRSEFRKALTAQLTEALPHGLRLEEVAKFQLVLNAALQTFVQDANNATVASAMAKVAKSAFPNIPAEVNLSDLMNMARRGFHKDDHESFYAYAEKTDYGSLHLFLDSDPEPGSRSYGSARDRRYSAKTRLSFMEDGRVYAMKFDGENLTPASRPDVHGEFEATLLAMYVGRTTLVFDMDADDVHYAAQPQEP